MPKIPEIRSGERLRGMRQEIVIIIGRKDIENQPESHIQKVIMERLAMIAPQILEEAMRFKVIWERETEAEERFFGKGKVNGH